MSELVPDPSPAPDVFAAGVASAPGRLLLSAPVLRGNEAAYLAECVDTGWVSSGGPFVGRFEDAMREVTGAPYAVACQSGTAALHVSLLLAGVGAGDAVLVPTLTFVATVNAVAYTGAMPVFMDCDDHLGMDTAKVAEFLAEECDRRGGGVVHRGTQKAVKAMLPVHVFGDPCDMPGLLGVAEQWGLAVIEDAAESLGSSWADGPFAGRHTGTVGLVGALSFNGNKICTCGGGGMVLTADPLLAEHARHLTTQAKYDPVRFVHDEVGYNYRLTSLQAAVGLAQVEQLDVFLDAKRRIHARYREALTGIEGVRLLEPSPLGSPNLWLNAVLVEPRGAIDRESVMAALRAEAIESRPAWFPNHRQTPYHEAPSYRIERATWFWERLLCVPSSSDLADVDVDRVAGVIRKAVGA